jgi:siroheme synthase-like protein
VKGFFVALDLAGKDCFVLGTSEEAAFRARLLSEHGARVVRFERHPPTDDELGRAWLVVLADRDPELAGRVGAFCEARRILFCAVDQPGQNSFHHVAMTRVGEVTVAIGTDGRAPSLARRLREELGRVLAASRLASFSERLASLRERTPSEARKERMARAVSGVHFTGELVLPELDD